MKKIEVFDDKITISIPCGGRICEYNTNSGKYYSGDVLTKQGMVSAYSQSDCSILEFMYKGILHIRTYSNKGYSPRYLTTLADRFSKKIVNKNR